MIKDVSYKKLVLLFGCLFFIAQSVLAVVFYRERLFADSSFFVFQAVNKGWFHIEHQRFLLAACQVLPLIGSYLGLPLKYILIVYSLNHVFFFFMLFLLLVLRFDDIYGGIAIMAILVLNSLCLYVEPYLETWYASGLAVLLYSVLKSGKAGLRTLLLVLLLEVTILFSHPENFILIIMFILLFTDIKTKPRISWLKGNAQGELYIMAGLLLASALFKYFTLDKYENNHFAQPFSLGHPGSAGQLIKTALTQISTALWMHFRIPVLLLLITIIAYIKNRLFRRATILFLFFSGCVLMTNFLFAEETVTMYTSIHYLPIVAMAVIPFFADVLPTYPGNIKITAFILLFAAFIVRNAEQVNRVKPYTYTMENTERLIDSCDKKGGNKFFVQVPNFVSGHVDWTYPIQTLLLSAERGPDKCRSIASDEDTAVNHSANRIFKDPSVFMVSRFEFTTNDSLNPKYFRISQGTYKTVDYNDCLRPSFSSQLNIKKGNDEWTFKPPEILNGKPSIHFNGDEYGLAFKFRSDSLDDQAKEYYVRVKLTRFEPKANSCANAQVVCDITDDRKKSVFYTASMLSGETAVKDSNNVTTYYNFQVPRLNLKRLHFSFYIWNPKKENFYITDASFGLYTMPSYWN